jgi:hypothetical protein
MKRKNEKTNKSDQSSSAFVLAYLHERLWAGRALCSRLVRLGRLGALVGQMEDTLTVSRAVDVSDGFHHCRVVEFRVLSEWRIEFDIVVRAVFSLKARWKRMCFRV